jgi:hypothetical protein
VICLDEMRPLSAKSYLGRVPIRTPPGRALQEIEYGRRGKGYIFGAPELVEGLPGHGSGVHRAL